MKRASMCAVKRQPKSDSVALGDQIIKSHGRHTCRFGGDYRDIRLDRRSHPHARPGDVVVAMSNGAFGGIWDRLLAALGGAAR